MALSEQLPIYRKTVDFQKSVMIHFTQIKKLHKHMLGAYVYKASLSLALMIRKANRCVDNPHKKAAVLEEYIDTLEDIGNALRLAHDTGIIDDKAHAIMSDQIPSLCKQATSWRNKTLAGIPATEQRAGREQVIKGYPVDTPYMGTT